MATHPGRTQRSKVMFGDVSLPPGGVKIAKAMRKLLETKSFESITTAQIAKKSGMTEALIYKHFGSKRDLLFCLLIEFHNRYYADILASVEGIKGALKKLRRIILEEVSIYERDRVYGRILISELGPVQGFYKSSTYKKLKKEYAGLVRDIINEGIEAGEIRNDVSEWAIRQGLLGTIRYMCLPLIVFKREIVPEKLTDDICKIVFAGIKRKK